MSRPAKSAIAKEILTRHPRSHAEEVGIRLDRNTPAPLYRLLIVSLLFSARIAADIARQAAEDLFDQGWTTPQKMQATSWEERVRVLNRAGYARYDESTARYIGDTTAMLLDRYDGDLRKLREEAEGQSADLRALITKFKGIGNVGADIFFREVQIVWPELHPFADDKALDVAGKLSLGTDARSLAKLVSDRDLPRLLSGLVRTGLAGEEDAVRDAAKKR